MLTATGGINQLAGYAGSRGCAIRGAYGEGSQAVGGFYQISNQITLGASAAELTDKLVETATCLLYTSPAKRKQTAVHCAAASAIRILRKQHRKQQAQRLLAGELWANAFDLVFTNGFGRPLNHQTVYKHLKKALQSCGCLLYTSRCV